MSVAPIGGAIPLINPEALAAPRPSTALRPAQGLLPGARSAQAPRKTDGPSFISELLKQVKTSDAAAQQAMDTYASGGAQNLHETMVTMSKADISFSLMVSVRNKLLDAYREVMRMS